MNNYEHPISLTELQEKIEELLACGALEFVRIWENSQSTVYIPYMMNDAVEDYLVLRECTLINEAFDEFPEYTKKKRSDKETAPGDYCTFPEGTTAEWIRNDARQGMILRKPDASAVTLWYRDCQQSSRLYQYHQIGHFWRKGQEQWRQLVYIVGTVFDKYAYIGEAACNPEEKELLPLITFGPFRYWSPVKEELESRYPESLGGILCIRRLAEEARDTAFLKWIKIYKYAFLFHMPMRKLTEHLAKKMNEPERIPLYELIYQKVCQASGPYPERDYGEVQNQKRDNLRRKNSEYLQSLGFTGSYPFFQKEQIRMYAAEEHPFTKLDYEGFDFRVRFMKSTVTKNYDGHNAGFFEGTGLDGEIVEYDL